MKIGIDIRDLEVSPVGVGNVISHLLESLTREDHENEYYLYQPRMGNFTDAPNFHPRPTRIKPYTYSKEQIYFSARSLLDGLDIFHAPIHLPPQHPPKRTKIIFTVHDLHSELDQKFFPPVLNRYFLNRRIRAIQSADQIIVHSSYVREKVLELSRISPKKIQLIPLGISDGFRQEIREELKEEVRSKYGLPKRFTLFVGSIEPWKNVPYLIDNFEEYRKNSQDKIDLVIIGRKGWKRKDTEYLEAKANKNPSIHWLGYLEREHLPAVYQMAEVFCSASIWEGFGLIFLEALASGLPVIAANRAAIPETLGETGLLFDPEKPRDLAEKFQILLGNRKLYNALKQKGLERARLFDWAEYGKKIHQLYMSLN